jgi:hypothetical protein
MSCSSVRLMPKVFELIEVAAAVLEHDYAYSCLTAKEEQPLIFFVFLRSRVRLGKRKVPRR